MREPLSCPCGLIIACQSDRLTSCLLSKFYDQYSSDDIFSQGYLIVLSVPCNISSFELN